MNELILPEDFAQNLEFSIKTLQEEFAKLSFNFEKGDLTKVLGIPGTVEEEFNDQSYLQDILFFVFLNQAVAIYLITRFDNEIKLQDESLDNIVEYITSNYGLQILFRLNIIQKVEEANPDILQDVFGQLSRLDLMNLVTLDEIGSSLQNVLTQITRKRFAANYTDLEPAQFLADLSISTKIKKLIDPMGGSGRLIFASLDAFQQLEVPLSEAVPRIALNELLLPAVQLYCIKLLIRILSENETDIHLLQNCFISSGDAFRNFQVQNLDAFFSRNAGQNNLIGKYDLVIMNPPFTRQGLFEEDYRIFLAKRFQKYSKFINRHMGLHGYALLLSYELLKPNGLIAAVLPASTIYSGYGVGLKRFLLQNFEIKIILTSAVTKAFSEGSDFREIIIICQKNNAGNKSRSEHYTKFVTVKRELRDLDLFTLANEINETSQSGEFDTFKLTLIPQINLESEQNWLFYFESPEFKQIHSELMQKYNFISNNTAGFYLVRGFEMYGPNFFLFPNKYWDFTERTTDGIIFSRINSDGEKISVEIPNRYLIPSLRKPQECELQIQFEPNYYALSVPPQEILPPGLETYFQWGLELAPPALPHFGNTWFYHVNAQLKSKQPFGRVFVVDKFSVNGIHNFAYFFKKPITCTKNFYVFQTESIIKDEFLAAWLNSSIFLFLFLAQRREIGGSYGRLQIKDYMVMPLFVSIDENSPAFMSVIEAFRAICAINPLPLLQEQFTLPERQTLDDAILSYLEIPEEEITAFREKIYNAITQKLHSLEQRD